MAVFLRCCCPFFLGGPSVTCRLCLQGATSTNSLQVLKGHLHSKALFLEIVGGFLKMSPCFQIGCVHIQRSHLFQFVAMEINVHTVGTPPSHWTDSFFLFFFPFLNQICRRFTFVKLLFWPLLYSPYILLNE